MFVGQIRKTEIAERKPNLEKQAGSYWQAAAATTAKTAVRGNRPRVF
jgi:hypothetical protein